ncbi:MAG: hypothetical protein EOM19_08490 [Candidatus Moranbacteria bacterium]|nr:hypothetical protein [Candidatus Moranbacteria bacterium]
MKQEKENKKEWQSVLVWSLVISGLLLLAVVTRIYLSINAKYNDVVFFSPAILVFLWGIFVVISNCDGRRKTSGMKNVFIERSIVTLFLSWFCSSAMFGMWAFYFDPIEIGNLFYNVSISVTKGIFMGLVFLVIPFFIGYFIGLIPIFLIRHALKLYRKHLKHILEPC